MGEGMIRCDGPAGGNLEGRWKFWQKAAWWINA
jgi:hypothetical protein